MLVVEMLDEVGRDRLVERGVLERQPRDVRELEPEAGEEPASLLDRERLQVDPDGLATQAGQEVRDRPGRGAEVEHPLAGMRVDERLHGFEPKLGPGRPLQVRGRHRVHELLVVFGRGTAECWQAHASSPTPHPGPCAGVRTTIEPA